MLRKGDYHLNITKKTKQYTEPNESYSEFNKENLSSKSMIEPLNDSHSQTLNNKNNHPPAPGSTLVSPTFQSIPQLSLKDHLYRQDPSYINVNFSLKDLAKKPASNNLPPTNDAEQKYREALSQVEEMKQRLLDHYKSKKYWNKISALFEHDDVDAVFAWQEAIEKYKSVKSSNEQLQTEFERMQSELSAKQEKVVALEKQLAQDKNETKVLSLKKCRGCDNLEQKEKQYQQLYGQNKKTKKQLQEQKEQVAQLNEKYRKLDEKYNNLVQVKEELEKKNGKLFEREKELLLQTQKMEKAFKEDTSSSKDLHIQIERLKEDKYQLEKTIGKLDEKHRRETADLKLELTGIEEEKNILLTQSEKTKLELNDTKARLFKMQFQLESIDETLKLKAVQCEELKKRHIQNMSEEMRRKNGLDDQLKNKEQELKRAYHLLDQAENVKINVEMELSQERKAAQTREEELAKQAELIKEMEERGRQLEDKLRDCEDRLREFQQNEHRIKESQSFALTRNKNLSLGNYQGNTQSVSPQHNSLLNRITSKIRELHLSITQASQELPDSYQKRKGREELSEDREPANLLRTQRCLNQICTEFFNFRNRHEFICKENESLKMQIQHEAGYKQQEAEQLHREIDLKEDALRSITAWIPEELRETVVEFLCATEQLAREERHEEVDLEEYQELKQTLEAQGREWKDGYQKQERRAKKMEDELRRLEQENEQLRRKTKADPKRALHTEYDYKKDIRKKYNI